MPLTRDFKLTVMARAARDPRFCEALLSEALNASLSGDPVAGRAMLRDLINATVGFEKLAEKTNLAPKSLHRMLSPKGNPTSENFFAIIRALQRAVYIRLSVNAMPKSRRAAPASVPAYRSSARATAASSVHERTPAYRVGGRKKA